jgi:hypothetical protein
MERRKGRIDGKKEGQDRWKGEGQDGEKGKTVASICKEFCKKAKSQIGVEGPVRVG